MSKLAVNCSICVKLMSEMKNVPRQICYDCSEAAMIIETGLDLYDKGKSGEFDDVADGGLERLEFLIQKGWRYTDPEQGRRKVVGFISGIKDDDGK